MGTEQLKTILLAQRERRGRIPLQGGFATSRRGNAWMTTFSILAVIVIAGVSFFVLMPLASRTGATMQPPIAVVQETPKPSPLPTSSITPTPVSFMVVCTNVPDGRLNVHFEPNTVGTEKEVRGYLKEGEEVVVASKTEDGQWIQISAPVEGWVVARLLCVEQ